MCWLSQLSQHSEIKKKLKFHLRNCGFKLLKNIFFFVAALFVFVAAYGPNFVNYRHPKTATTLVDNRGQCWLRQPMPTYLWNTWGSWCFIGGPIWSAVKFYRPSLIFEGSLMINNGILIQYWMQIIMRCGNNSCYKWSTVCSAQRCNVHPHSPRPRPISMWKSKSTWHIRQQSKIREGLILLAAGRP